MRPSASASVWPEVCEPAWRGGGGPLLSCVDILHTDRLGKGPDFPFLFFSWVLISLGQVNHRCFSVCLRVLGARFATKRTDRR